MKTRIRNTGHPAPAASDEVPVAAQGQVSGIERITEVYGGGYVTRIREALADVYEAVRFVLGERRFMEMAAAYAASQPSHEYNLSFVGRHLAAWLDQSPLSRTLPFLPDLARLEWLICQAFHAFDEPPAQLGAFATLPMEAWERVRFEFQPSMGLLASAWPIRDIWAARTQPRPSIDIDTVNRPQCLLIHRHGVTVACEVMEPDAWALLQRLAGGETLGEACAGVASRKSPGDREPQLARWFAQWAGQGVIRRIAVA